MKWTNEMIEREITRNDYNDKRIANGKIANLKQSFSIYDKINPYNKGQYHKEPGTYVLVDEKTRRAFIGVVTKTKPLISASPTEDTLIHQYFAEFEEEKKQISNARSEILKDETLSKIEKQRQLSKHEYPRYTAYRLSNITSIDFVQALIEYFETNNPKYGMNDGYVANEEAPHEEPKPIERKYRRGLTLDEIEAKMKAHKEETKMVKPKTQAISLTIDGEEHQFKTMTAACRFIDPEKPRKWLPAMSDLAAKGHSHTLNGKLVSNVKKITA